MSSFASCADPGQTGGRGLRGTLAVSERLCVAGHSRVDVLGYDLLLCPLLTESSTNEVRGPLFGPMLELKESSGVLQEAFPC